MVMADASEVATELILARRAWAVAARNNDRNNDGKEGNPPVPNDATASGSGDDNNASSADNNAIKGCLCVLNEKQHRCGRHQPQRSTSS
jgi:hypothetical protein